MLDSRKEGEPRGKIINIASLVSFQGMSSALLEVYLEYIRPSSKRTQTCPDANAVLFLFSAALSLLSIGGLTVPAYAAAKHGILGLTKGLSNEWASQAINVNASETSLPPS